MKRTVTWIIYLIMLLVLILLVLILIMKKEAPNENERYSCNIDSDCVSQCTNGCVNIEWAGLNPDMTECFKSSFSLVGREATLYEFLG